MKHKKWLLVVVVMFVCSGCFPIAATDMRQLATHVQELSGKVDTYQEATSGVIGALAEHDLVSDEVVVKVDKVSEEIDRVQPQVAAIAEAIKTGEYSNKDTLTTILEAIRTGNRASGAFNPYALYVEIGLTGIIAVLGLFAKRKADEAKKNGLKYQAHKAGVQKTAIELDQNKELLLYENIGKARADLGVK